MSEPEAQDTLEAHGIRWRFNFLADIPDGDGRLYRREPKWVEKDLTPSQRGELEAWIAEQRWQPGPGGWLVPADLQDCRFLLAVVPDGLRVSASAPGSGEPATWIVLAR